MFSFKFTSFCRTVFRAISNVLHSYRLQEVVLDFERAAWKAITEVFNIQPRGCVFHWKQALWRKIAEVGLGPSYKERSDVYTLLSKLMALPYLPKEFIPPMFTKLAAKANTEKLEKVCFIILKDKDIGPYSQKVD